MNSFPVAALLSMFALVCSSARASAAAPIQNPINGHYYEFIGIGASWYDCLVLAASSSYLGVGGHLATITSQEEQDFVYNSIVQPNLPNSRSYAAWLGGFQPPGASEPGGGWLWATAESWTYSNWGGGEPNNGGGGENALAVWGDGSWNDFTASGFGGPDIGPTGYIIEYSIPEPSQVALTVLLGACLAASRRKQSE